jgi:hypothetical protein
LRGSVDRLRQLATRGVEIKGNDDLCLVAAVGHLELLQHLVLVQQCDACEETGGVTPLVAALREQHVDCALWLIHRGAVADIKARMKASLTGRDVMIDQPLLDALVEARGDAVLAALVYEFGAAGSRFPDCLLQALLDADWTSALSLYGDDSVLDDRTSPPSAERARPRRQEFPELAQSSSMRRHASSTFPVHQQNILAQFVPDGEDRAPWASRLEMRNSPNAPSVTKHVNEPTIVVFPGQCRLHRARREAHHSPDLVTVVLSGWSARSP